MFKVKDRINFFDADPAGIIFFANIYNHAHYAYELFLENLNTEENYFESKKFVLPIIHSEADYTKPFIPGERISIAVSVSQLRENSFELEYKFLSEKEVLKGTVKTVHVCVNKNSFEKIKLSEDLRSELTRHLG